MPPPFSPSPLLVHFIYTRRHPPNHQIKTNQQPLIMLIYSKSFTYRYHVIYRTAFSSRVNKQFMLEWKKHTVTSFGRYFKFNRFQNFISNFLTDIIIIPILFFGQNITKFFHNLILFYATRLVRLRIFWTLPNMNC